MQSLQTNLNAGLSYQSIANLLNMARKPTRQGKKWSAVQVYRVIKRNKLKKKKRSTSQKDIEPWTKEQIMNIVKRNKPKKKRESY